MPSSAKWTAKPLPDRTTLLMLSAIQLTKVHRKWSQGSESGRKIQNAAKKRISCVNGETSARALACRSPIPPLGCPFSFFLPEPCPGKKIMWVLSSLRSAMPARSLLAATAERRRVRRLATLAAKQLPPPRREAASAEEREPARRSPTPPSSCVPLLGCTNSSARQQHQQPPHRHPPRACRGRKGARRRCRGTERRSPTLVQSNGSETKR